MQNHEFTNEDLDAVIRSWNIVCSGSSEAYQSISVESCQYADCVQWFFSVLFEHLLEIHPSASRLFDNMNMKELAYVFSTAFSDVLSSINSSNDIHATLMGFALIHSKRFEK